ncbi:peptide deformylase [Fictibacillus iocasae]|uniref:Peptide deformylase n=1 Tax=Fictibacillus iocasae TaxID=2715437 RepID=A0ABW2NSB8_9BACL
MAVKKIVLHPDPVLEERCLDVTVFDKKLAKLVRDMFDTMYEAEGVGLAAPQIGITSRVAVVDTGDDLGPLVLINPVITKQSGSQAGPEGCLSFPGLFGDVDRAEKITVEAMDQKGRPFTLHAEGFTARAILHETDHLNGVLFTSKVTHFYEEGEFER